MTREARIVKKPVSEKRYVRAKEAAAILGVSIRTIWNYANTKIEEGFPKPIRISESVTLFPREELINFAESKRT